MGRKERAEERRKQRQQEISLFRTIPYSDHQRWWNSETIAVVTGANRGIGFEIARQLCGHGLTVILTSRDSAIGREAASVLQEGGFNAVSHQLMFLILHLSNSLLNGCSRTMALSTFSEFCENAENVIATNYFGTKNVIKAMVPLMKPSASGARIVNVSSRLGRINGRRNKIEDSALRGQLEDVDSLSEEVIDQMVHTFVEQVKDGTWTSAGWPQTFTDYSVSKLAVNCYTRIMAKVLSDRPEGNVSVEEGADTGVWLALLPDQSVTGKIFAERREVHF
ncbi:Short-chain dehydrogenase/reductase 2b [Vitis vinifera]|uniref:Short-chain dehydrogenase/reductase 2b n=1 Tax=Vitis vinifera TaxID=29760 RepID=A0A438G3E0_VITVI|nr:Short-chain dehydrogenase/reductase 2b [Vitis vinifera]